MSAIGNRKVGGGKGFRNWYSLEKEIARGKEYAQQIEASAKLVQDPTISEYVNRIGQKTWSATPMRGCLSRSR